MIDRIRRAIAAWAHDRREARARNAEERARLKREGERIVRAMALTADKTLNERRWG